MRVSRDVVDLLGGGVGGGPGEVVKQSDMQLGVPHSLEPLSHQNPAARPTHDVTGLDRATGLPAGLGVPCRVCL